MVERACSSSHIYGTSGQCTSGGWLGSHFRCLGYLKSYFSRILSKAQRMYLRFSMMMTFQHCCYISTSILGPPISQVPSSCQDFVKEIFYSLCPLLHFYFLFSFLLVNSFPKCSEQQPILLKKGHSLRKLHILEFWIKKTDSCGEDDF